MTLSREQMLVEMGISPIWVLRDTLPVGEAIAEQGEAASPVTLAIDTPESVATASASENQLADRSTVIQHTPSSPTPAKASGAWPELLAEIAGCRACVLCEQRKQAVPGVGDQQPDWLFIGEGPGAEEDVKGEPFVGQAGKLLDAMLDALDIARGQKVYIANAVKCRPPGNRTPEAAEMAACKPFLERQIALLKPKIIVLLGKAAVHAVLGEDKSLASLRGSAFEYAGIPVVVTYHPAYLLRNLPDKAKAWEDLLFARRTLRAAASPALPF